MYKDDHLERMLSALDRIRRTKSVIQPPGGLSHSEHMLLRVIQSVIGEAPGMPGVRPAVLSERLGISKPAVSQALSSLEQKGYIKRDAAPNDRRAVHVCLTDEGLNELGMCETHFRERIGMMLSRLGTEDSEKLLELIEKASRLMKE